MGSSRTSTAHLLRNTFEKNVRDYVNRKLDTTAVAGVCRMRSEGVDLLQITDLLLGAIVYEHKAKVNLVKLESFKPKASLLSHLKHRFEVETFTGSYRDARLNIAMYREQPEK